MDVRHKKRHSDLIIEEVGITTKAKVVFGPGKMPRTAQRSATMLSFFTDTTHGMIPAPALLRQRHASHEGHHLNDKDGSPIESNCIVTDHICLEQLMQLLVHLDCRSFSPTLGHGREHHQGQWLHTMHLSII
jgi:hypothetical protein